MRYVIMAVAAVFALVNWAKSPEGRSFRQHIQQEQARHTSIYDHGDE